MLWHTEPTSFDYSTVYRSGPYRIRHYTENEQGRGTLGFGMIVARLYRDGVMLAECTGPDALSRAQAAAVVDQAKGEAA
jgi:hypothetical protein